MTGIPMDDCGCHDRSCDRSVPRRDFIRISGLGALMGVAAGRPVMAGPFGDENEYLATIASDKKLDASWVASLFERGKKDTYTDPRAHNHIGMPVGGIGAGLVYLGGDGRLWMWDVFNKTYERGFMGRGSDGATYVRPFELTQPFAHGFNLRLAVDGATEARSLDGQGFAEVSFDGRYPMGIIHYRDAACPVSVQLEAFSPFIPLDMENSSYPATVMRYTLTNTSSVPVEATVTGWVDNPVCLHTGRPEDTIRRNAIRRGDHATVLQCTAEKPADDSASSSVDPSAAAATPNPEPLAQRHDYGTFALAAVGGADCGNASAKQDSLHEEGPNEASQPSGRPLIGTLGKSVELAPGESKTITFIVAWHFPNLRLGQMGSVGRSYAKRFADATAVADHVAAASESLFRQTRLWVDTWYDSTLPYWLLDRTMATASTLATTVCYLFRDGRFYGWEGVNCCPGTCTHVWHYAQSPGRLFPQIERLVRQRVDFGIGQHADGAISHRTYATKGSNHADDGHCGRLLGVYRDHQMSADDGFLRELWPNVKKAIEFLFTRDADGDGILEGAQPNTLDAAWYGRISFTSSLHIAAMRAGEQMAHEMGDDTLAGRCRAVADAGRQSMLALFNGEYFHQIEDEKHLTAIGVGTGCYIDQMIGQTWAHWTDLGELFDREKQLTALRSLWRYNFVPDVGPFRERFTKGRWYASAGDAGLIMCTWPREPVDPGKQKHWQYRYFNECMSGFEYQAAAHMIWEGHDQPDLLQHGLAISRAVHDRYDAQMRNPYNEIECSDHYARAMASYGVFQAVCGFNCHGPKGRLTFIPRLEPKNFRAAFTAAGGWGTFEQRVADATATIGLSVKWGEVLLRTLCLSPTLPATNEVSVTHAGTTRPARAVTTSSRLEITFNEPVRLVAGEPLSIVLH